MDTGHSSDTGTGLWVTTTATGDEVVVALAGDLDYESQDTVSRALRDVLDDHPGRLVVDLDGVAYCDSSGLRVLEGAAHDAPAGTAFLVRGARGQTARALRLTGLDDVLAPEPDAQAETDSRNAKNVDDQRDAASTCGP